MSGVGKFMWPVEVVVTEKEKRPDLQADDSARASGTNSPEHSRKASDTAEMGVRGPGRSPTSSIPLGSARTAQLPGGNSIRAIPLDAESADKPSQMPEVKLKFQPEEPKTKILYNVYEGSFKENKMHGSGVFTWVDGQVYEGEFVDDHREGYGIIRYTNGSIYDGYWRNGLKHGEGCAIDPNGQKEYGKFVNDKLETPLRFKK